MSRKRTATYAFLSVVVVVLAVVVGLITLPQTNPALVCEYADVLSVRPGPGPAVPGVAGAPRWGMPEAEFSTLRVRRSWSILSDEEKRQYLDGILLLKQTTVESSMIGAERANYESFCPGGYTRNLYDYYVELHASAFASMGTEAQLMEQMAHMGPHFLPWHRYLILRMERDMQEALGDPDFTLPYWDWDDCAAGTGDGANPCPLIFEEGFLGSHGGLEEAADVTGYLVDQGYEVNVWAEVGLFSIFNPDSVRCGARPLRRAVGMDEGTNRQVPNSTETIKEGYQRPLYDAAPYEQCRTDETVSFRQYLEGYVRGKPGLLCIIPGACATHGLGHTYVGGDMSGVGTTDPIFFLHHANVDRIWAMWQDNNRENADTSADYGNPGFPHMWYAPLFNFPEVRAEELFDFRALGYTYDSIEPRTVFAVSPTALNLCILPSPSATLLQ